jgi:hypothetical protein
MDSGVPIEHSVHTMELEGATLVNQNLDVIGSAFIGSLDFSVIPAF